MRVKLVELNAVLHSVLLGLVLSGKHLWVRKEANRRKRE